MYLVVGISMNQDCPFDLRTVFLWNCLFCVMLNPRILYGIYNIPAKQACSAISCCVWCINFGALVGGIEFNTLDWIQYRTLTHFISPGVADTGKTGNRPVGNGLKMSRFGGSIGGPGFRGSSLTNTKFGFASSSPSSMSKNCSALSFLATRKVLR
jgi:hypothetical protein